MDVEIINEQTDLDLSALPLERLIVEFLKFKGVHGHEIAIHFVDTEEISRLHGDFFDDPTPTDCITLPIDTPIPLKTPLTEENYAHLGEVFVCPATAIAYCKAEGGDPVEETVLYLVHGLLHLLGYGDVEEEERSEMRKQEQLGMAFLKKL